MKKILSFLGAVAIAASSASAVISCSKSESENVDKNVLKKILKTNLGVVNDLKPLTSNDDNADEFTNDNIFNCDYNDVSNKKIDKFWDYGKADRKIGYYEIAKRLFKVNKINPTYEDWLNLDFELKKSNEDSTYELILMHGEDKVVSSFKSDQEIQLTLNTVLDGNSLRILNDGSIDTILSAENKSLKVSGPKLNLNNRLWKGKNEYGYGTKHSVSIDNNGKGTVQIYDESGLYGGAVNQKVEIKNYNELHFDDAGNPYFYYNDLSCVQQQRLNKIENDYKETTFDPQKHVIVFGLDGFRYDKFNDLIFDKLNSKDILKEYSFYSQAWESVYGWKQVISGSISGDKSNIFQMVNNAKNGKELSAVANLEWLGWDEKVFPSFSKTGLENIKDSFSNNGKYNNWSRDQSVHTWLEKAKEIINSDPDWKDTLISNNPGSIDWPHFDVPGRGINNPTDNDLKVNTLKSWTSFKLFEEMISESKMPNLAFQYDTMADDEGHEWNTDTNLPVEDYYSSKALNMTTDIYVKELNQIFDKYKSDPNYLLLITTDHGRDEYDASHNGYNPSARRSFYVSNQDLTKYTEGQMNQSSLKEIVFNFLKK